ncbi:MAG: hypothetical protein L3J07_01380 [Candidatus Magasanikbacteria bacterium]|nr:hypothetical protein [Candidatus Magasanikbacteria bacterium]
MENKKQILGQFFTKNNFWLRKHVFDFIKSTNSKIAFDPFAGGGDLLKVAKEIGFKKTIGLDVDLELNWKFNDSLLDIPIIKNSIIITNPPYLTNYSAKRKKIYKQVANYFESSKFNDLYQIAIERSLKNNFGVMIIPETFINSKFPKHRMKSITIIEGLMFEDTEIPTCVVCFDNKIKNYNKILLYKNDKLLGDLDKYEKMRFKPTKNIPIKFNAPHGKIALRAVDTTSIERPISFMKREELNYSLSKIKQSSRLITLIDINIKEENIEKIIEKSNKLLQEFRIKTDDVLLSPFKGNKKNGERRRRLDYLTARAILEKAYDSLIYKKQMNINSLLYEKNK